MKDIFKLKTFWVVSVLSVGVIFVALANFNRIYRAETEILVVTKSVSAALAGDQIVENLANLPESLSFLNRMLENDSGLISEDVRGMTPYKKKDYWKNKIESERIGESGIIEISVTDKSQYESQALAQQVARTLISSAGLFYDVENEVAIRIIEEPIVRMNVGQPILVLFLESLAAGLVLSFLSFFISFWVFGRKKPRKEFVSQKPLWYREEPVQRTLSEKAKKVMPDFSKVEKSWTPKKETPRDFGKKAAAPDNLPVAPEGLTEPEKGSARDSSPGDTGEKKPILKEATPEEVKERLNKLLSGKL